MQTEHLRLTLDSPLATLDAVGGKGAALAKLASAGLPVPRAFFITTAAYHRFVEEHDLQASRAAAENSPERPSATIQALFGTHAVPKDVAAEIGFAYAELGGDQLAVAVRSSATAEDLPELSFAGQQDTYLNVRGADAVLDAVRRCWASLWTERAIAYRRQHGRPSEAVAMGVIVQVLVRADVSGVLFTADPVTGERDQVVVNASFGLGESIVAGEITPDSYRVDRNRMAVLDAAIGDKRNITVPAEEGGTITRAAPGASRTARALTDAQLVELTRLAMRVEVAFGNTPQDIEFAIADGTYWILQARPITNLPPPPLRDVRWEPPIPGSAWIRRQVVENMPEPLSPLFSELYLHEGLEHSIDAMYGVFNISDSINRLVDRPLFTTVHGYAYMRANINFALSIVPILVRAYANGLPAVFNIGPGYWRDEALPRYLGTVARWKAVDPRSAPPAELLRGVRELAWADAIYWFAAAVAIGVAKVSESVLSWFLAAALPGRGVTSGHFLRGFPSKTLEAEAAFERLADRLRESDHVRQLVESTTAAALLERLRKDPQTRWFEEAFSEYLDHYGHQIYNLDFVEPTQAEDPLALLLSLKARIAAPSRDIEGRRQALARERDQSVASIARSLDPVRGRLFRLIVRWAQQYGPYREEALFYVGAAWPTLRHLALELGQRLTDVGALDRPADVFFLETPEIEAALAGAAPAELAGAARERGVLREARKRLHPPAAVPPQHRLKLGPLDISLFETQQRNVEQAPVLRGFAVSPGRVTAPASLIKSPSDFARMQPDSILVCPTTTPAWTPLFAQARGLVTDIGGVLAHGSIVAREYGIPAVMGTGVATQRIQHGQVITVDGDTGTVALTADAQAAPAEPLPEKRTRMRAALVVGAGLGLGLALLVTRRRRRRRRTFSL